MKIKYVVIPGWIVSKKDKQKHYVNAMELIRLYGVDWRECEVYDPEPWWTISFYQWAQERRKGLIELRPRYDGNYSLPSNINSIANTTHPSRD